jgi:hypothetical protein
MTTVGDSPLQAAKERLLIPALWLLLNLPGKPGHLCRSPFRKDRNPSFSIYDGGRRWKDHGTGEGGDAVDFLARALNLSNEDAFKKLIELAGVSCQIPRFTQRKERQPDHAKEPIRLELPSLVPYSKEMAQRVADSRRLGIAAVEFAALWLKTVVFGRICGQMAWVLTDASRNCAEARRIDAKPFPAFRDLDERKSHALAGSCKSWPLGILPPAFDESWLQEHVHKILLVEGGPDYLAACQIIAAQDASVLPVAMLGAGITKIGDDALRYFRNRHVTVVAHADEEGRKAGVRWAKQIQVTGAKVKLVAMMTGDLCDAVSHGATDIELL